MNRIFSFLSIQFAKKSAFVKSNYENLEELAAIIAENELRSEYGLMSRITHGGINFDNRNLFDVDGKVDERYLKVVIDTYLKGMVEIDLIRPDEISLSDDITKKMNFISAKVSDMQSKRTEFDLSTLESNISALKIFPPVRHEVQQTVKLFGNEKIGTARGEENLLLRKGNLRTLNNNNNRLLGRVKLGSCVSKNRHSMPGPLRQKYGITQRGRINDLKQGIFWLCIRTTHRTAMD